MHAHHASSLRHTSTRTMSRFTRRQRRRAIGRLIAAIDRHQISRSDLQRYLGCSQSSLCEYLHRDHDPSDGRVVAINAYVDRLDLEPQAALAPPLKYPASDAALRRRRAQTIVVADTSATVATEAAQALRVLITVIPRLRGPARRVAASAAVRLATRVA